LNRYSSLSRIDPRNKPPPSRHVGKLEVARLHALFSGKESRRLAVPLDEIRCVEYRRDEVRVERRMQSTVRIGNLDAPGALRELANVLAS
jgi:hypothetical protein